MSSRIPNQPKPLCFTSAKDWQEWQRFAAVSVDKYLTHCTDCLPSFKEKMIAAGKCDYPLTRFKSVHTKHGRELIGVRPDELH